MHRSFGGNIGYALKVAGWARADRDKRVAEVSKSVGLSELLDRKPCQRSGGQRQRLAMARAIIREPKVFLFDEPLSNLDAKLRVQMRHEIRRIHNRIGATSVFVTHDQHEGMTLADRMVIMNKGTIDQVGSPEEVYNRPATLYVAGFIGSPSMNFLEGRISAGEVVFDDGARLPLQGTSGMEGTRVQVGVRPETLELCDAAQGALQGQFEFYEELGSGGLHHLMVGGQPFSVLSEHKRRAAEGTRVGVQVPAGALHVFDAESGLRLDFAQDPALEPAA